MHALHPKPGPSPRSQSLRLYVLGLVAALALLIGGAWLIAQQAINHLLFTDAVAAGHNWASYLALNISDLREIANGEKPSATSMDFFQRAQQVGHVFRYKIFAPDGRLRLASDRLPEAGADDQNLAEHNTEAASFIAAGKPLVEVKEGQPPDRPPFFAEAYVPVRLDGKTIAIVEAYVDQTDKREEFRNAVATAGASLSLLTAIAFGLPAIALYRRTREKLRADAQIDFLAHHDAMTGLPNRNHIAEKLRQALTRPGARLALHTINIDRFKDINDTLGHDCGDGLIMSTAERLCALVDPRDLVARLGGDEFAVLQIGIRDDADAAALAQHLSEALAAPYLINGHEIATTASIGVALAPHHGDDALRLLRSADLALYKSKADGRNGVRFFTAELDAELQQRLKLEKTLRDATINETFELHFQPLFGMPTNNLVGFEALLRLHAEDGSFISPAIFIPVAEEIGLIGKIGAWVLHRACITATAWPPHLTVAVNLSPAQFTHGNVYDLVDTALSRSGLAPQRLELEITESLLLGDTGPVLDELSRLKARGVAIVMDDFGTGYSSLSYLWRFPFNKIKIDRAFMQAYDVADRNAETVVRTIAELGRSLNMRVTVEGVENERQVEFLRNVDCDQVQGFFFGRPMPIIDLAACIMADVKRKLARATVSTIAPVEHETHTAL
jgi:diguanylate cyclase (GGDEF)-like protein